MRTSHQKGVSAAGRHPLHPASPMNTHGGAAARPHDIGLRRRLLALRAGVLAAVRALRAKNPKTR